MAAVIVGHRGWPTRYPDNTLSGLLAASAVADMVEIDVRRCGDGKLVLSHDPFLSGFPVHETSWSRLAELDLGDGHHPALLDEVIASLPETPIQVEVKNWPTDPGFESDHRFALETAERTRPGDIVTGFNWETITAVRRAFPEVATGIAFDSPVTIDQALAFCRDHGHRALIPAERLVDQEMSGDIAVYPWTVNDPGRARELAHHGVAGIITDDPGLIDETLRSDHEDK